MNWRRGLLGLVILGTSSIANAQTAPFTLALSAAKYEVKAGDPVDIRVVMINTSNHDVDCTTDGSNALDRSYEYNVRNEQGQPVVGLPSNFRFADKPGITGD